MKAMSTTLVLVVGAVVILVTALVLLTIFGSGITPLGSLSNFQNQCRISGESSCETTKQLPLTWSISVSVGDSKESCESALNCKTCQVCFGINEDGSIQENWNKVYID